MKWGKPSGGVRLKKELSWVKIAKPGEKRTRWFYMWFSLRARELWWFRWQPIWEREGWLVWTLEGSKGRILPNHMPVMSSHWSQEGGLSRHTSFCCFLLPGFLPHCPPTQLRLHLKTKEKEGSPLGQTLCSFWFLTLNAQHASPSPRCCSSLLGKPQTQGSVAPSFQNPHRLRGARSALPYRLLPQHSAFTSSCSFSLLDQKVSIRMQDAMKINSYTLMLCFEVSVKQTKW